MHSVSQKGMLCEGQMRGSLHPDPFQGPREIDCERMRGVDGFSVCRVGDVFCVGCFQSGESVR